MVPAYAWRGAEPQALGAFAARLSPAPHRLTGNWRSSPVICRLAATLRTGQRPSDTSVVREDDIPVLLLPTRFAASGSRHLHALTGDGIVDAFCALAEEYAIEAKDCLVTAYKHATLPGITREKPNTNAIASLAWARTVVHTPGASCDDLTRACAIAVRVSCSATGIRAKPAAPTASRLPTACRPARSTARPSRSCTACPRPTRNGARRYGRP
ncbi:hypothetical protein ABZ636_36905 [Streptomyces sp. NPDC007251]|uniref:hypothetical protein n=1 Tax=Streptomyces sp. NPDC007251 TaxID=3154483 RepID=UPI0034096B31